MRMKWRMLGRLIERFLAQKEGVLGDGIEIPSIEIDMTLRKFA